MRLTSLLLLLAACADGAGTNTTPTVTAPQISPSPAFNDSTVTATASTQDADGDAVALAWSWRNDTRGADLGTGAQLALTSAVASPDDVIVATVIATDDFGGEAVATSQIVVTNRAPLLGGAALTPSAPLRAGPVSCAAVASDDDDDAVTYTYAWTINGAAAGGDEATLAGPFAVDDVVACTVTVDDGHGGVITGDPASGTVANAVPVFASVSIDPAAPRYVGAMLTCRAEVADPDGDAVSTTFAWTDTVTGAQVATGAVLTLNPAQFQPGRSLTCTATAVDASGGFGQATAVANVDNRAPTVAPTLAPSVPHPGTSVVCDAGAVDPDGLAPTVSFAWQNSTRGTNLGVAPSLLVGPGAASVGDELMCTVTAVDAQGLSATASASGTVSNEAPTVTVSLSPSSPSVNDVVRCSADAADGDGDALTITRDWTIDGVSLGADVRLDLPTTAAMPGDELVCTVTVADAAGAVTVGSASAVLSDAPVTFDTADTAFSWPTLAGFTNYALFAYDPATDSARGWTEDGVSHQPTFGFIFFNEDYQATGDFRNDACLYQLEASAPLPRASWAYLGSAYLFGLEFDPLTATISTNCEAFFGDVAPLWDIVGSGVWGAAVSTTMDRDVAATLLSGGNSPSDYLGGVHYATSPQIPVLTWGAYTLSYQVQANFDAGPALVPLAPAQAHGVSTLNRGVFDVETTTLWLFQ